jgi:ankyrin repeat protein
MKKVLILILIVVFIFVALNADKIHKSVKKKIKVAPAFVSTYLGGSETEFCEAIALDEADHVYVAGYSGSANFPITSGTYNATHKGKVDVFVMKFDKDLKSVLASTLIGGTQNDCAYSILYDRKGFIYVAGYTDSEDFPTTKSAYSTKYNGGKGDAFILKMDSELKNVVASTFLGGSGVEDDHRSPEIVQDNDGNIYIAGITASRDFPTTKGALFENYIGGIRDVFVSKLDPQLKQLLASTFIGGKGDDRMGRSLCIDAENNEICVGGYTMFSQEFPVTENAYSRKLTGGLDGFILKMDMNLTQISASTILDGWIYSMMIHENGDIYVGGHGGNKLPTPGAYWTLDRGTDEGFIARLSNDLSRLKSATLLPGTTYSFMGGSIVCLDLAQNRDGNIISTGWAKPFDFPSTPGTFDETQNGESDTYILEMNKDLSRLETSSFIGGSKKERWNRMAIDKKGNFYIASYTASPDFPVAKDSVYNKFQGGNYDGFICRLNPGILAEVHEEFHHAAKMDDLNKIKQLLSKNRELLNKTDKYNRTALHSAARYGSAAVTEYLLKQGADLNNGDERGNTPLHLASSYRFDKVVEMLVNSKNIEINAVNDAGYTPLYMATIYGNPQTMRLLYSKKADGSMRDKKGNTLLHIAALNGHIKKVEEILRYKPEIDSKNKDGLTPLQLMIKSYLVEQKIVELLLDHGASLKAVDKTGKKIIHIAYPKPSVIKLLICRGVEVNAQDNDGNTRLHLFLSMRLKREKERLMPFSKNIIKILLDAGAKPKIKNKKGETPLGIAIKSGNKEAIDLLKK